MNVETSLVSRAKVAGEAALRAIHPPGPLMTGAAYARSAELYRHAIHLALAANAAANGDSVQRLPTAASHETHLPDIEVLLAATPPSTLLHWALTEAHLERCIQHLRLRDHDSYAALDQAGQQGLCTDLDDFYRAMMVSLLPTESAAEVKRFKRDLVWLALGAVALMLSVFAWEAIERRRLGTDLAPAATWSASSIYGSKCQATEQECSGNENYFFHTHQENNPWLMFDFKKSVSFSSIEVDNRLDCCSERANPLIVSVSDDQKAWRVVAESRREFTTFEAKFPTVSARYLKFEIPQPAAMLHLSRVRVFP